MCAFGHRPDAAGKVAVISATPRTTTLIIFSRVFFSFPIPVLFLFTRRRRRIDCGADVEIIEIIIIIIIVIVLRFKYRSACNDDNYYYSSRRRRITSAVLVDDVVALDLPCRGRPPALSDVVFIAWVPSVTSHV